MSTLFNTSSKTFSKILTTAFFFVAYSFASSTSIAEEKAILILDASGSMWGQLNGQPKIKIANTVISDLLDTWSPTVELGVMAYGHREKKNCQDIETLVEVGPVTQDSAHQIRHRIKNINPKGKTPLSDSVRKAAEALKYTESEATVILVSDGLETCSANPCAVAQELENAGIHFTVHTIGFGTSSSENEQLKCMADHTGGYFFSAGNAGELQDALNSAADLVEDSSDNNQGTIAVINIDGPVIVKTQEGKRVATLSEKSSEPHFLPAGFYQLTAGKIQVDDVEVFANKTITVDFDHLHGSIRVTNVEGAVRVINKKGKTVATISARSKRFKQIPPGTYQLKARGKTVENVVIAAGDELVYDFSK